MRSHRRCSHPSRLALRIASLSARSRSWQAVPAHDEAAEANGIERTNDAGEPLVSVQSVASSHARLPCDRSIRMSG